AAGRGRPRIDIALCASEHVRSYLKQPAPHPRCIPSPACGRTRVYPSSASLNRPKSDISDFGWRDREGACNKINSTAQRYMCPHYDPLPNPPPQAGEGADRIRRSRQVHSTRKCSLAEIDGVTAKDLAAWHATQLRNSVLTPSRRGRDRRRPTPCPSPPSRSARP